MTNYINITNILLSDAVSVIKFMYCSMKNGRMITKTRFFNVAGSIQRFFFADY